MEIDLAVTDFERDEGIQSRQQKRVWYLYLSAGDIDRDVAVAEDVFGMADGNDEFEHPAEFVLQGRIEGVRLYLKGSNLLTFSKFKLWDPELDTSTGSKYPIMKAVSIGLDINF